MSEGRKITGYDPMTGAPIYEEAAPAPTGKITGYDPMTGAPVYEEVAPAPSAAPTGKITGYDPMTGEPVYEGSAPTPPPTGKITGYDPMTGEPVYSGGKGGSGAGGTGGVPKAAKIAGIVAGGIVVVLILALIVFRIALGRNGKFLLALKRSADLGAFVEALDVSDIILNGDYTTGLTLTSDDLTVEMEAAGDAGKGNYSYWAHADADGNEAEATLTLDKKTLALYVPEILDDVLVYNYTEDNDGYIAEQQGMEQICENLEATTSMPAPKKYYKLLQSAVIKSFNKLKFHKISSKGIKINGKKRDCKGYSAELNEAAARTFLTGLEKTWNTYEKDAKVPEEVSDKVEDFFDTMSDQDFDDIDDSEIHIYLYGGKVARLEFEAYGSDVLCIEFHGGDYWTQNMTVESAGTAVEISGKSEKKVEKRKISAASVDILEYKYNTRSGELQVELGNNIASAKIKGKLVKKGKGFSLTVDDIEAEGMSLSGMLNDASLTLTMTKGAKIKKVDTKTAVDLGDMSEEKLTKLAEKAAKNGEELLKDLTKDLPGELMDELGLDSLLGDLGGYDEYALPAEEAAPAVEQPVEEPAYDGDWSW
ncbi:MAG: hypothetical protein K5985_05490 [Lachnospiraceae bacterium]|nr:hypothetical protein [Lachnospiraceae bacterium]